MSTNALKLLSFPSLVPLYISWESLSCVIEPNSNWLKHSGEFLTHVTENPEVSAGLR